MGKILTKEIWFYLSVQQTVTQMVRGGEAVTGGYSGVVINESHLSTTCTATAGDE